jgi:hypothetical protein
VQIARFDTDLPQGKLFDAPLVRIFSFICPGSTHDDHREEVLRRMRPG